MCLRVVDHPIIDSKEQEVIQITINGRTISARKGEPIAAAMLAAGIDVFRYTEKRKEARGLFCGIGQCNDCTVVVNGQPNVRSCVTPIEEGMVIETQRGLGRFGKI